MLSVVVKIPFLVPVPVIVPFPVIVVVPLGYKKLAYIRIPANPKVCKYKY